jgi:tRNA 2-thiouridine synthesizing protein A
LAGHNDGTTEGQEEHIREKIHDFHRWRNNVIIPDAELDCVGLYCPMPISMTKEEIEKIDIGQVLKIEADDPAAEEDIIRWAKRAGHEIIEFVKEGTILTFLIRRMK